MVDRARVAPADDPSATVLVLLRHGRTELNAADRLQGSLDPDLDEAGVRQAELAGAFISERYDIDHVVTSPLVRAQQTAEVAGFGSSAEVDPRFAEVAYGVFEGEPVRDLAREMIGKWSLDIEYAPPGGESMGSLIRRVSAACEETVAARPGETVLVVSHQMPIKAAVTWGVGGAPEQILRYHMHHASVSVVVASSFGVLLLGYNQQPLPKSSDQI
jgi:broad specificity phosphatase PhoE